MEDNYLKNNKNVIIASLILVGYLMIGTCVFGFIQNIGFDEKYFDSILGNFYFRNIVYYLYFIFFGVAIGLENFLNKMGKNGKLTIKWGKLLIQGLPMLYIGFHHFLYFSTIIFLNSLSNAFFIKNEFVTVLGLVAFGYIFITSINKE